MLLVFGGDFLSYFGEKNAETYLPLHFSVKIDLHLNVARLIKKTLLKLSTRWAPTGYKWSCNPYKCPYEWLTGVITPIHGVTSLLQRREGVHIVVFHPQGKKQPSLAQHVAAEPSY